MVRKSTPPSGTNSQKRRTDNNNISADANEPQEPGLITPQQQPPALTPVPDFNSSLAPPKPLSLQGTLLPTPPSYLQYPTPSSSHRHDGALCSQHEACPAIIDPKPLSTLAILNDFLENAYKLQERAHQLWLEEQREMKRGIALNIIYSPASDASHHSQHFTTPQRDNEPPSCCVTPGAQVMHDLGQDHLLFSPPSAKMDTLFGVHLASTPTAGQLTDHTSAQLLSPTALGLHTLIQDGSARSLPGSAHAPFHSHRPNLHSQFNPLHSAPPASKAAPPTSCQDPHLSSPPLPYHPQPQSPTTQRYWQPLSGGSSAGTAPTLRCPPALSGGGLGMAPSLASRSPLSRQHNNATSAASLASKPSRALLFHHTSSSVAQGPQAQQDQAHLQAVTVGSGIGDLSPRCGFRAGFGASSFSLRQQLLQQQLESSAVESPTAALLPRAGKANDPISCPDSPADYLLSQPSSSKHPFQQTHAEQQQQQQQQLDFLGGLTHSDLRLCTTPLAKRQKR